ncbi:hypothetical protein Nepgr_003400 [Nepenthes gracilis]|uniref:Uncharacterized protein n=1 Tax=Nepenthes gracilis TaxID=150966 RepID=A0AAD3XDU4_NEPGR|nr:hypothetical protein Nepgr_003400 [Nepenthes gracilis]
MLDENKIYFSSLFSPPRKQNSNHKPPSSHQKHRHGYNDQPAAWTQQQGQAKDNGAGKNVWEEDVNAEAEEFIEENHRNFKLMKRMSRSFGRWKGCFKR